MKHFFSFLALALMASAATARELVVTLKDGTRQAFHLSASEHVVMLQAEDGFTLNGLSYKTEDVAELRIFKNVPEDATDITAVAEPKAEADRVLPVYDLSGRRVAENFDGSLSAGVYIINNKKVIIR